MTTLRFAIIGCGKIARRHAQQIQAMASLVAVCDTLQERADSLAAAYQTKAWYNIDDLLKNERGIDVVVVCTPNGLHAAHSIKALQAGFHVLCEKPMAIQVADAEQMISEAAHAGKQLFIVKQNRYNPPVLAVRKALQEKKLGQLYSFQLNCYWNRSPAYYQDSWRGTKQLDGGTLFTQFSHFIDLLYWMAGDVKEVKALLSNYAHKGEIEFEDTGMVLMQLENGVTGAMNYTVNSFNKNMEGSLTLFAEKGTVKIGGQYLNQLEYQEIEGYTIDNLPVSKQANDYGTYQGSMSNHDKVYENVIAVLQHNAPVTTTAAEALKTVEIIERIYQAAIRL
jgi:predicted dehydrogenase